MRKLPLLNYNILLTGFSSNHSCETCVNYVVSDWKKEIDDKNCVVAEFLDLKRAFETVDHKILLNKLEKYGIRNTERKWFKNFIYDRTQKTSVNNNISDSATVATGVPQGTILGVLLFLLYINDMEKVVQYSKLVLFADDSLNLFKWKRYQNCD